MKYTKYILSIAIPFSMLYLLFSLLNYTINWYRWTNTSIVLYSMLGGIATTLLIIHNLAMDLSNPNNIEVTDHETVDYEDIKPNS